MSIAHGVLGRGGARYPRAHWRPLSFAGRMPSRLPYRAIVLHTNGGGPHVFDWFNRAGNDIASHFQIFSDGRIEQYIAATRQAYAAFASNGWAIQVETEDDGHPERSWTDAQVEAIVDLCRWAGCPAKALSDGPSDGVGWHSQFADWNRTAHSCPGTVRMAQVHEQIIPALRRPRADYRALKRSAIEVAESLGVSHHGVNARDNVLGPAARDLLRALAKRV